MASLADYQTQIAQQQQTMKNVDDLSQTIDNSHLKDAAAQAAQLYQQGDLHGAIGTLMKVDPKLTQQIFQTLGTTEDPQVTQNNAYGKEKGDLTAKAEFGQLPTQIQEARGKAIAGGKGFISVPLEMPDGTIIPASRDKGTGKLYYPDGSELPADIAMQAKQGYAPAVRVNPNTKDAEIITKAGGKVKDVVSSGAPIEADSQGQAVMLKPIQVQKITKDVEAFNKDPLTKDLTQQINSLNTAKEAIIKNVPGAGMLEKMRLIRGMTPRPAVQEVMALNYGQGWETTLESYTTKASGQGLAPEEQKNFLNMVDVFQKANLDEYNQHLHSRAAQTAANAKVGSESLDPSIVMKRYAPELPTPIQEALKKVAQLPKEEQAIIDQAHQYLLTHKRSDPDYNDALKVLRLHGL